jgi:hypothetical protein
METRSEIDLGTSDQIEGAHLLSSSAPHRRLLPRAIFIGP